MAATCGFSREIACRPRDTLEDLVELLHQFAPAVMVQTDPTRDPPLPSEVSEPKQSPHGVLSKMKVDPNTEIEPRKVGGQFYYLLLKNLPPRETTRYRTVHCCILQRRCH
ncbi:hypothetical protein Enr13x_21670 [Stieleria neptunia]|uniref:Uncharacterized protein n=1 Tax=Stieleria neptunia TaxID=2527979 RepID=A0A518HN99_9BACT|nr:hypothetical protein Enr13x_21670 [Stieleria neptunia]